MTVLLSMGKQNLYPKYNSGVYLCFFSIEWSAADDLVVKHTGISLWIRSLPYACGHALVAWIEWREFCGSADTGVSMFGSRFEQCIIRRPLSILYGTESDHYNGLLWMSSFYFWCLFVGFFPLNEVQHVVYIINTHAVHLLDWIGYITSVLVSQLSLTT